MKIVAVYKTFRGEDFVIPSVESIYDFCSNIIFIHSNTSWDNEKGNTVLPVIDKWTHENDKERKVFQILGDWNTQEDQYRFAFDIANNYNCDYYLIIDTDEVWTKEDLVTLNNELIGDNYQHDRFTCRMRTYIKSPYYRISPIEPCTPTIIVKKGMPYKGIRGNGLGNKKHLDNVFFDHFCYVRNDIASIKSKFITSEIGDKHSSHKWEYWKPNIWDKIPNVLDMHPTISHEKCWHSIEKITKDKLPITVQKMEDIDDWEQ